MRNWHFYRNTRADISKYALETLEEDIRRSISLRSADGVKSWLPDAGIVKNRQISQEFLAIDSFIQIALKEFKTRGMLSVNNFFRFRDFTQNIIFYLGTEIGHQLFAIVTKNSVDINSYEEKAVSNISSDYSINNSDCSQRFREEIIKNDTETVLSRWQSKSSIFADLNQKTKELLISRLDETTISNQVNWAMPRLLKEVDEKNSVGHQEETHISKAREQKETVTKQSKHVQKHAFVLNDASSQKGQGFSK